MQNQDTEDDGLHAAIVVCPQCHTRLYRVDTSPMAAQWILYCEACARRVVVEFYDAGTKPLWDATPPGSDRGQRLSSQIEAHLKPCVCGGAFRVAAPRRCYCCQSPVLTDAPGVDLWPVSYYVDYEETEIATPGEMAQASDFEETYVRRTDIWLSHSPPTEADVDRLVAGEEVQVLYTD